MNHGWRWAGACWAVWALALSGVARAEITNGLVAYYPFNGNANDASGNGNDGTPVGSLTFTNTPFGSGLDFPGPGVAHLDLGTWVGYTNFTIGLWVYPRVTEPGAVLLDDNSNGPTNWACQSLDGTNYNFGGASFTLPAQTWSYLVLAAAPTGLEVYVNGQFAEHETSPRGVYCGAIGYVRRPKAEDALSGLEARFSVAIRTTVIDKTTQVATYGSGGGITSDSVPEVEWHELLLKADVLRAASTGSVASATLLETMRFDPADRTKTAPGIRNLNRHLDRLHGSADRFDRSCPPDLRRRLVDSVADLGPVRVRLLLHPDGSATIEHHPLPEDPTAVAVVRLCIDHVPVDPADVGLFHKTTDRRRYHERSDRHFDADDVVLVNARGEVTETTRANLAVRLDDRWCTPPIDSGLLPGVERGRLVDAGVLHERIISVAEFREAEEIATVSSLRGWTPAVLHSCLRCQAGS